MQQTLSPEETLKQIFQMKCASLKDYLIMFSHHTCGSVVVTTNKRTTW